MSRLGAIVVGAVLGLLPFFVTAYLFEGLEHGLEGLFGSPETWIWLAGFCGLGALVGWAWSRRRARRDTAG